MKRPDPDLPPSPPSPPAQFVIWVRTKRQAMDWSLVLASQDISAAIACDQDQRWSLVVDAQDQPRALESIQQYLRENRRHRWTETLLPPFAFQWGSFFWSLALVWFHGADHVRFFTFPNAAMMNSAAVSSGQWWRFFTAIWLHKEVAHLAGNAGFGFLLLGIAMAQYGSGAALLMAFLGGAAGNLFAWLCYPGPYQSLGASGMVMAALGLVGVQSVAFWRRQQLPAHYAVRSAIAGGLLFVLLGLDPNSDILAHLGGFLAGLFFGLLLVLVPKPIEHNRFFQGLCWLFFILIAGLTLTLAALHS